MEQIDCFGYLGSLITTNDDSTKEESKIRYKERTEQTSNMLLSKTLPKKVEKKFVEAAPMCCCIQFSGIHFTTAKSRKMGNKADLSL